MLIEEWVQALIRSREQPTREQRIFSLTHLFDTSPGMASLAKLYIDGKKAELSSVKVEEMTATELADLAKFCRGLADGLPEVSEMPFKLIDLSEFKRQ